MMEDKDRKVLSIIKEDGTKEEVELLVCFEFNDTKKEYAVYTRNEKGRELLLEGGMKALANREERYISHKKVKGALE
mgnify:CR=1 FL=1